VMTLFLIQKNFQVYLALKMMIFVDLRIKINIFNVT
jgi:hypothetical protein